jgi:hypothetical protein
MGARTRSWSTGPRGDLLPVDLSCRHLVIDHGPSELCCAGNP